MPLRAFRRAARAAGRLVVWRGVPLLVALFAGVSVRAAEVLNLDVATRDKDYLVDLEVRIAAPMQSAWDVFTDYEHLTALNPALHESRLLSQPAPDTYRVRGLTRMCVLIFCKSLRHVQRFRELQGGVLEADIEPRGSDFTAGHARWEFSDEAGFTRVVFKGQFRPRFWVPPLIGPWAVKRALRQISLDTALGLERIAQSGEVR